MENGDTNIIWKYTFIDFCIDPPPPPSLMLYRVVAVLHTNVTQCPPHDGDVILQRRARRSNIVKQVGQKIRFHSILAIYGAEIIKPAPGAAIGFRSSCMEQRDRTQFYALCSEISIRFVTLRRILCRIREKQSLDTNRTLDV
jgi:hypothetical protein